MRRNRKALVNYTRCRTGKGNLLRWEKILGPDLGDTMCRRYRAHVALVCV